MKEIIRERKTTNLRQLKKYVDKALENGADTICFQHFDSQNPYFVFKANFTPEEERVYELDKLKKEFNERITDLENQTYKTYSFRKPKFGLSGKDIDVLIFKFIKNNNINAINSHTIKQVITDEYDDFDDSMETVFITEIIQK